MKQFTKQFIDITPGLKSKLIASGVSRSTFSDIKRHKTTPKPQVLHQICFIIAKETNKPMYDILISAIKMIESEM